MGVERVQDLDLRPRSRGHGVLGPSCWSDSLIAVYRWTVAERPLGSEAALLPSPDEAQVAVTVEVAGLYRFDLQVVDNYGQSSMNPCQVVVEATAGG